MAADKFGIGKKINDPRMAWQPHRDLKDGDAVLGPRLHLWDAIRGEDRSSSRIYPRKLSMIAPIRKPLFELGQVVATPAAAKAIEDSGEEAGDFLNRHAFGDWGSLFDDERERNNRAVQTGGQIISEFRTGNGVKIRVVTAAVDPSGRRPTTTILLPSEFQR